MAEQCEMVIGFLVPHRCDNPALGKCVRCGKGFCDEHLEKLPEGGVCSACMQGLAQPVAVPLTATTFTPADVLLFNQAASAWEGDDADITASRLGGSDMFSDMS